jgi:hypothetical protein
VMRTWLVVLVIAMAGGASYALDHGLYVGSGHSMIEAPCCPDNYYVYVQKTCRYLYITGISALDALDGGRCQMLGN